ncbi:MAG: type III pantothenate kinase, partial [Clostridia bacterium]
MILAIDVGNSNVAMGVYDGERLVRHWRLSTVAGATADDLGISMRTLLGYNGINCEMVDAVVYATVVPPLVASLEEMCLRYLKVRPLKVGPGTKTGIDIKYDNPREVGPDRIANAVAAQHLFGGPSLVVDFGTATTFDVISEEGN